MKKVFVMLMICSLLLASACSGGNTPTKSGTPSGPSAIAAQPTAAPKGISAAITAADGTAVGGAIVSLADRSTLKTVSQTSGADGKADFGNLPKGKYFLTTAAVGYLDSRQDVEITGSYQVFTSKLDKAAQVKHYLLAFCAVSAKDKKSRVYLAQSDDGSAWELFPGYTPFEGTGSAVNYKDGIISVYSSTQITRYSVANGVWDATRPYTTLTDNYFNGVGSVSYLPLNREPSFFKDKDGKLILVGANIPKEYYAYLDAFLARGSQSMGLVGWAEERDASQGLAFYYQVSRYLYKDIFATSQAKTRGISSPFVIAAPDAYYLLLTKNSGIIALQSAQSTSGYTAVPGLKGGVLFAGANSGATGVYDADKEKTELYIVANAGGKPTLSKYELDGLTAAITKKPESISLAFLGEAPTSISSPNVWDTTAFAAVPAAPEMKPIGFGSGWFTGDAYINGKTGSTQTNSAPAAASTTLTFSKDTSWIYNYRDKMESSFTCSADIKAGTGTTQQGLAYCWNPVGTVFGGYVFSVDGKKWTLSLFQPNGGDRGYALTTINKITVLASGDYAMPASGCTLTVHYSMGSHELYINGDKVGQYKDTSALKGFGSGFIGLYAVSGDQDATIAFTPVRIIG